MNFKKVESSFATVWDPKEGESIIGKYAGEEQIPSPTKPGETFTSWKVRLLEDLVVKGETVKCYGISGAFLASKFDQIPLGATIKVTYAGRLKTTKGMAKQFEVEADEGVTLLDPYATPTQKATKGNAADEIMD